MALFDKKTLVQNFYYVYMMAVYTLGIFVVGHLHGSQRYRDICDDLNAVIENQENLISLQDNYIDCLKDLHLICQQNLTSCEENQTDFSSEP